MPGNIAVVAVVLAVGLGLIQRAVERHRSHLVGRPPLDDDSNNTGLYAIGKNLPVGDWTGFGIALLLVTAVGGAWTAVTATNTPKEVLTP